MTLPTHDLIPSVNARIDRVSAPRLGPKLPEGIPFTTCAGVTGDIIQMLTPVRMIRLSED